jgi:hypothetical protein
MPAPGVLASGAVTSETASSAAAVAGEEAGSDAVSGVWGRDSAGEGTAADGADGEDTADAAVATGGSAHPGRARAGAAPGRDCTRSIQPARGWAGIAGARGEAWGTRGPASASGKA